MIYSVLGQEILVQMKNTALTVMENYNHCDMFDVIWGGGGLVASGRAY